MRRVSATAFPARTPPRALLLLAFLLASLATAAALPVEPVLAVSVRTVSRWDNSGKRGPCEQLADRGGVGVVLMPFSEEYRAALSGSWSPNAQELRPLCVVRPSTAAHVAALLRQATEAGFSVTPRGGGHTLRSADSTSVMLDLSELKEIRYREDAEGRMVASVQGGAHMGALVQAGEGNGWGVPVGTHPAPGFGLLTQGGVGYLSRQEGLTLDHILSIEVAVPSGEVLTLSEESTGREADLWWAVRGAAPFFGVVTGAELQAVNISAGIYVHAAAYELTQARLATYLSASPKLPRGVSVHCLVGRAEARDAEITLYATVWPPGEDAAEVAAAALAPYGEPFFVGYDGVYPYSQTPPLAPLAQPAPRGGAPARGHLHSGRCLDRLGETRVFGGTSGLFMRPVSDATAAAAALLGVFQWCPSRMCGIDFQQAGGAVGDVPPSEMAFGQRSWEWNVVFHGNWLEGTSDGSLESEWIRRAARAAIAVPGLVSGYYAVDIGNNGPEGAPGLYSEFARAYGESGGAPHVARLCRLKKQVDPENVLARHLPLCPPVRTPA